MADAGIASIFKTRTVLLTGLSQFTSAIIASRIPEMRIISMIAITRLGRLNSSETDEHDPFDKARSFPTRSCVSYKI